MTTGALGLTGRVDVNAFIGRYPYRHVPGAAPDELLHAMDRVTIEHAWISNLSSLFWRDPTEGNETVYEVCDRHPRLHAIPVVQPELDNWRDVVTTAGARRVPAIRVAPSQYGLDPVSHPMRMLLGACGESGIPLLMAIRLEDGRQRHPHDVGPELTPAAIRTLIRTDSRARLIITHADREFVEQVHFGATPAEAARLLWDICWIWGPPEDHLELLLRTVGMERFTFGSGMPLRIPENSVAKVDLLQLSAPEREALDRGNLERFLAGARAS